VGVVVEELEEFWEGCLVLEVAEGGGGFAAGVGFWVV
jgi:hypothetical protein